MYLILDLYHKLNQLFSNIFCLNSDNICNKKNKNTYVLIRTLEMYRLVNLLIKLGIEKKKLTKKNM